MDTYDLPRVHTMPNPRMLTDDEYKVWLKGYLDLFYVYFTEAEEEFLRGVLPTRTTTYLKGTNKALKRAVSALMFVWKYQDYRYMTVSDLVSMYLGKAPDGDADGDPQRRSHLDTTTPLFILHHLAYIPPNTQIDNLILQVVAERENRGLTTLVLDETNLSVVRKAMNDLDLVVIEEGMDSFLKRAGNPGGSPQVVLKEKRKYTKTPPVENKLRRDPLADGA